MGGGISRHELAAAVSEAGGLGTIAVSGAGAIRRELAAARALTGRPLAVNVLLPFARRDWFEAAAEADVVVTFWGEPRRRTGGVWLHQCGSVEEARRAQAAGADGVIVQGVEAGGHVRGTTCAPRSTPAPMWQSPAPASCSARRAVPTLYIRSACWRPKKRS